MSRHTSIPFRIVDAFFRHLWLFVIAVTVVTSVTAAALLLRGKSYHATAMTQVVVEDVASELGVKERDSWTSPAQQNVNHFNDLLNDDLPGGFIDTALKSANLDRPLNLDPAARDERFARLKKQIYVTTQSQTTFQVGLTWDRPDECRRIIEALRQQYIQEVGLEHQSQSIATSKFLDSQIRDYEARMRDAEQVLIKYRAGNTGQLPEAQSANISQLSSLQAQLDNMRISAHDGAMRRQAILGRLKQTPPMSILEQTHTQTQTSAPEPPIVTQIKQLRAKRDALLAGNMLPAHPLVSTLQEQIDSLEKQWQKEAGTAAPGTRKSVQTKMQENPEYQALQQQLLDASIAQQTQQAQMALVRQEIVRYEALVRQIPAAQRELTDKTRNYAMLKAQYEALLGRREQAQLKGNLDKVSASSSLSPIGSVYAEPTTGQKKLLLMLAGSVLLGLVVGCVAVVLSEWSDRSLRYAGDAERLLGVPVIGLVPEAKNVWRLQNGNRRVRQSLPAPEGPAGG